MMGSGKSTVGRLLAERLGVPHIDSDEQVEAATGRTVREIWESEGEAAFREEESRALARALKTKGGVVVAVAGGAVLDARNRTAIKRGGTVVWLRARLSTLVDRATTGDHRPLLADDPVWTLHRLNLERKRLYEEVADVIVDVDELTVTQVVGSIVAELAPNSRP